jgi:cyclopropane-fatty-acyl-phospholipid synthase
MTVTQFAEKGLIPDFLIRWGIRKRLKATIQQVSDPTQDLAQQRKEDWIKTLKESPVALVPELANEQHYELPPGFFELVLGKHLKYSSGYWPTGVRDLDASEAAMLQLSCERAELSDGMDILELGCGWGSLSLWMAENYPNSRIVAVSNSGDQREFIERRIADRAIKNLQVQTKDMNTFSIQQKFDRVVSIEMFEHMRNYEELMTRISEWLKPEGKLFVHIFTHRSIAYPYLNRGPEDWMTKYFFEGGQMPSADLLPRFGGRVLELQDQWEISGKHYQKTSRAWLDQMDRLKDSVLPVLEQTYGKANSKVWYQRWRLFFMACEELFGFRNGTEWYVSHYLFKKRL